MTYANLCQWSASGPSEAKSRAVVHSGQVQSGHTVDGEGRGCSCCSCWPAAAVVIVVTVLARPRPQSITHHGRWKKEDWGRRTPPGLHTEGNYSTMP